ncbi:MAG TPA: cell division protein [Erythrobacter sp.]|nr:cell division protein [Erythrobacter sp.]
MKQPPPIAENLDRGATSFGGRAAAALVPRRRISGPVPWVLAIMIMLSALAAGGALALSNLASSARGELAGAITVQIIEADAELRAQQSELAAELLLQDPAVRSLRRVPREELDRMMEPWLGVADAGDAIPIPDLLDVQLNRQASEAELVRLQSLLENDAPNSRIDAQSSLLEPVYSALTALRYLSFGLIVLLALASSSAVWLASRSAFTSNRETMEIVHLLGGADKQIAGIFQRSVAMDVFMGAVLGLALGVAVMLVIAGQFAALDSGMVEGGGFDWHDWLIIAAIPIAGVLIAIMTARMTVVSALRRML